MAASPIYDRIGQRYTTNRRSDPRIRRAIERALGDARTVVNVGAGTGSYEPTDRLVIAVEPSAAMLAQRPAHAARALRAAAEALPFHGAAFDASLAILTMHHWSDRQRGLREMRRVSRRVVLLTWDADVGRRFWLLEYFPELLAFDIPRFPPMPALAAEVGGHCVIEPVPIPRDCEDGFLGAFWARPEVYLDAHARAGMSTFAFLDPADVERGVERLRSDLQDGSWHKRHGALLKSSALDLGYRLVVSDTRIAPY
jgi:SAM-dependent methyltransferase